MYPLVVSRDKQHTTVVLNGLVTVMPETTLTSTYNPVVLPDYHGNFFQQPNARLVQFDWRGVDNKLVVPSLWYSTFRPGTLVLIKATLIAWTVQGKIVRACLFFFSFLCTDSSGSIHRSRGRVCARLLHRLIQ